MNMIMEATKDVSTVGGRIMEARRAAGMTQQELAAKVGISRAAVGQWELDSTSPPISRLEEVAMVLGVAPQWLAYNVQPGAERIIYRSPERDNVEWVKEVLGYEGPEEPIEGETWGIPGEFLSRELRSRIDSTVIAMVNSHAVEPELEYGDRVFVDTSDRKPSPPGIFCYWDGLGMAFAHMQALPGKEPKIRIQSKDVDAYEVGFDEIKIIGRVRGHMRRS